MLVLWKISFWEIWILRPWWQSYFNGKLFWRTWNQVKILKNLQPRVNSYEVKIPINTAWKVSKYGVSSGPYFPVFALNTEKYGPEKTPYLDTFHAVEITGRYYSFWGLKWMSGNLYQKHWILSTVISYNEAYVTMGKVCDWYSQHKYTPSVPMLNTTTQNNVILSINHFQQHLYVTVTVHEKSLVLSRKWRLQ